MSGRHLIRRATVADSEALAALGARTFHDAFGPANRPEDMDAYLVKTYGEQQQRIEIEDPRIVTLVIEDDGALIAFAQLRLESADRIEIARFYVDRPWQGRGIAHELMTAAMEEAAASRAESVWLGVWERNPRAIAFYEKCGFRDTGSQPFLLGGDLQTDRVMVRDLSSGA